MSGLAFTFDAHGCKAVLRKHAAHDRDIRKAVAARISEQVAHGFAQTKPASRLPFRGQRVYECRVNVGTLPAIRVAFTVRGGDAVVVFMSTDIQKSEFTRELDAFLR